MSANNFLRISQNIAKNDAFILYSSLNMVWEAKPYI